mgnify:FL=1
MENNKFVTNLLFPLMAIVIFVIIAGILGILFMVFEHFTFHGASEPWGVVIIGTVLVVLIPVLAAVAQQKFGEK